MSVAAAHVYITMSRSIGVSADVDSSSPAYVYRSRSNHIHGHRPPVDSILCRIPVPYPISVSTVASRHGHYEASQDRLRCSSDNVVTSSFSERVRCGHACPGDLRLSWCLLRWYSFTVIATYGSKVDGVNEVLI